MMQFTNCDAVKFSGAVTGVFHDPQSAADALKPAGIDVILHYESGMDASDSYTVPTYRCDLDTRFKIQAWCPGSDCPLITEQDCWGNPDTRDGEPTSALTAFDLELIESRL